MATDPQAGEVVPGLCAEHGGLMWSNAMRACITPDDVIRGGCRWQPLGQDDEQVNYLGSGPSVKCAYPPCTNRLARSDVGGDQWCSKAHRTMTLDGTTP